MASSPSAPKEYTGFILFERGYRPFFPAAAMFAGFAIPLWVVLIQTGFDIPSAFSARDYHVHEMIFGYLGAIFAGFLFTALPNWTNRPAITGTPLALLFLLWLLGRAAIFTSSIWPAAAGLVDSAFLAVIASVAWKEILAGGSIRNIPVCLLISLLALANILYHNATLAELETDWIERAALGVVALLISLVGGRVIPNFSGNWMKKNNLSPLPAPFATFDKITLAATFIGLASWASDPQSNLTGYLFSGLCLAHAVRLFRWRGWQTTAEPLVLILHIAYAWLPVWFGLTGLAILSPDAFSASNALHALTAGTIGTMTMAIMTRAILGHSGRPLTAGRATQAIYAFITLGALLRVFADNLGMDFATALTVSGSLWATGFILFVLVYGPYCLSRKI